MGLRIFWLAIAASLWTGLAEAKISSTTDEFTGTVVWYHELTEEEDLSMYAWANVIRFDLVQAEHNDKLYYVLRATIECTNSDWLFPTAAYFIATGYDNEDHRVSLYLDRYSQSCLFTSTDIGTGWVYELYRYSLVSNLPPINLLTMNSMATLASSKYIRVKLVGQFETEDVYIDPGEVAEIYAKYKELLAVSRSSKT